MKRVPYRRIALTISLLLILGFAGNSFCENLYWQPVTPPHYGGFAGSLLCLGPDTVLAAGLNGVYKTTDNGVTWNLIKVADIYGIAYSLAKSPSGNIYLAAGGGEGDFVSCSTDSGGTFRRIAFTPFSAYLATLSCDQGGILYAGNPSSGVYRSLDGGFTWTECDSGLNNKDISVIAVDPNREVWLGTDKGLYHSNDLGETWQQIGPEMSDLQVTAFFHARNGVMLAGTWQNGVYASSDSGRTWVHGSLSCPIRALTSTGPDTFFAATNYLPCSIYRSIDNGLSWTEVDSGLDMVRDIAASSSGDIFVGTDDGIFFSSDKGLTWTRRSTGMVSFVVDNMVAKGNSIWIGTMSVGSWETTDFGKSWHDFSEDVVASDPAGNLLSSDGSRSTDNGVTWSPYVTLPQGHQINSVAFDDSGNVFVATTDSNVFFSSDTGGHWTKRSDGLVSSTNCLALDGSGHLYAGTWGNGLYRTTDNGITWEHVEISLNCQDIRGISCKGPYVFIATEYGQVAESTDYGTTWTVFQEQDLPNSYFLSFAADFSSGNLLIGSWGDGIYQCGSGVSFVEKKPAIQSGFELAQNYPNPFNPTTIITYYIAKRSHVRLTVYDVLGRQVASLVNAEKSPGQYQVTFDGSELPSGVYFYRVRAGSYTAVKKLLLIK